MRDRVWMLAAASGGLALPTVLLARSGPVKELVWLVLGALVVAGTVIATRRQLPAHRTNGLVVGGLVLLVGTLVELVVYWLPPNHVLWRLELAFYPIAFVVLAIAINQIAVRRFPAGDLEGRVDTLIVMVGMAAILIVTVSLHATGGSLARQLAIIAMPLTMAPILAACIRLLITGAHRIPAAWCLTVAATANLVATLVLTADPEMSSHGLLLALWILAFTLLAVGCALPSFGALAAPATGDPRRWQLGRLAAIGVALLALPASNVTRAMSWTEILATTAAILCVILVLWRLARVLVERDAAERELARRADRSAALSDLGRLATSATGPREFVEQLPAVVGAAFGCTSRLDPTDTTAGTPTVLVVPLDPVHGDLVVTRPGRPFDEEAERFVRTVVDLAGAALRRWEAEARLHHSVLHDTLTGLPNRASLMASLERELARAARHDTALTVLFIDLDGFKAINDSYGHAVGDELLTAIARRLEQAARGSDLPARLAGDEFVVVCPDTPLAAGNEAAARLTEALSGPYPLSCGELMIGASIGVAAARSSDDAARLLHRADAAMYVTKALHHERLGYDPA